MQSIFVDTETLLFGKIADELSRVSEEVCVLLSFRLLSFGTEFILS